MNVLSINNISKCFFSYRSELQRFISWFSNSEQHIDQITVLKDISFDVKSGQAIGIVGKNGAGKSTLLKMITGTLQPTSGTITVNGHIASILELGMGFNPELTGKQNAEYTLGLLGLNALKIKESIEQIAKFSELGKYFNKKIRIYSSGMAARLAFSVATAQRPEILIVDEALSVGDAYFQHKCFDLIREFQKLGTSLLIVSHDAQAILTLCNHAIMLDNGQIVKSGNPEMVMNYYNAMLTNDKESNIQESKLDALTTKTQSGSGKARVIDIKLIDKQNQEIQKIKVGEQVTLKLTVKVFEAISQLVLGYSIRDRLGQVIFGTNTFHTKQEIRNPAINTTYTFDVSFYNNLGPGNYSIQVALHDHDTHIDKNYQWLDLAFLFEVYNAEQAYFEGLAWLPPTININHDN